MPSSMNEQKDVQLRRSFLSDAAPPAGLCLTLNTSVVTLIGTRALYFVFCFCFFKVGKMMTTE